MFWFEATGSCEACEVSFDIFSCTSWLCCNYIFFHRSVQPACSREVYFYRCCHRGEGNSEASNRRGCRIEAFSTENILRKSLGVSGKSIDRDRKSTRLNSSH